MNRFWVIGNSKKVLFPGKSVSIFSLSYFCTLFSKNWLFATRPPFLNRWYLINGSFLSRVTFHMVNVKRVVLYLLFWSNVCIWRLRFLIHWQSRTVLFICRGGSTTKQKVFPGVFFFILRNLKSWGKNKRSLEATEIPFLQYYVWFMQSAKSFLWYPCQGTKKGVVLGRSRFFFYYAVCIKNRLEIVY